MHEPYEPSPAEQKLRRWQVRSVAIATLAGLLMLLAGVIENAVLAWVGISVVSVCLLAICTLGAVAWWKYG